MLAQVTGQARPYPAIVAASWKPGKPLSILVARTTDVLSADVAFLGHLGEDMKCNLVGSLGSYSCTSSSLGHEEQHVATNASDFWVKRSEDQ